MSLDNQELLTLYHMVFVFIFVATAIVALGGIMKVGPFQKIPPQYVKLLVSALIIELIASVLIVFKNLPEIKTINVERYSYKQSVR